MKTQNYISQLTLDYYHRGLATRKERKEVEKALLTDASVRKRLEELQELERETKQLLTEEMRRLNIQETPAVQVVHSANIVWGIVAAAAVLICVLVPVFHHFRSSSQNKNNAVAENPVESPAEETTDETDNRDIIEETKITENTPVEDKAPAPEQYKKRERGATNDVTRGKIAETPRPELDPPPENGFMPASDDFQFDGIMLASPPEMVTEIRFRGQSGDAETSEEDADIAIPPGITFIFENMFANKFLVWIKIPDRIKSIAKNAYAGNPIIYVTISADVDVHDEAIPGNFAKAYNSYGRQAGFYTRPGSDSEEWKKE